LFRVLPDTAHRFIQHEIEIIELVAGEVSATIQLSSPDLILERSHLLTVLLERARAAGVKVHFGFEFQRLVSREEGISLQIMTAGEPQFLRAEYLIGADGVSSSVRQTAGFQELHTVPLLQAEIKLPTHWNPGLTKVWFEVSETPFFFWLIPESKQKAVVGLIAPPGGEIRNTLDDFLKENGFQALAYQSGLVSLHSPKSAAEKRVGDLPILLVGDAAGQVKNTTVGGTVTGLLGAQAAVETILGDKPYHSTLRSVRKELDLHVFIRGMLNKMHQADYQNMIGMLSSPVESFLRKYDRDAMQHQFWKLAFLQPRLMSLGLSLFLRRGRGLH
jgi:flavin-dependent dehydrogenase